MFFGLHSPCTILIQYECHETYCTDYKSKKKKKKTAMTKWLHSKKPSHSIMYVYLHCFITEFFSYS